MVLDLPFLEVSIKDDTSVEFDSHSQINMTQSAAVLERFSKEPVKELGMQLVEVCTDYVNDRPELLQHFEV